MPLIHDHNVAFLVMYNLLKLVKNDKGFHHLAERTRRMIDLITSDSHIADCIADMPACDREEAMGYLKQHNIRLRLSPQVIRDGNVRPAGFSQAARGELAG
jgi:hypothetical protein